MLETDNRLRALTEIDFDNATYRSGWAKVAMPELPSTGEGGANRAQIAMALCVMLFEDLLQRTPSAARYVDEIVDAGGQVCFDHGALRTIDMGTGPTGALPQGADAFRRILTPLGYEQAEIYPLDGLKMTGYAFRHKDAPETVPQFFVSELHVDRFSEGFGEAAGRVFHSSRDLLTPEAKGALDDLGAQGSLSNERAEALLPVLFSLFDRVHDTPALADYEALLAESREAAWIATEGNAFNHATDRVPDVEGLADRLRCAGYAMKEKVEVARGGAVRQTALRADMVERDFVNADGKTIWRTVPGSFYEYITRERDPESGMLDLGFDSSNAQGIFTMTRSAS